MIPPSAALYVQLTVTRARDGKVMRRTRRLRSRSFLEQYCRIMHIAWSTAAGAVVDTGTTSRTLDFPSATNNVEFLEVDAASGTDVYGIQVGTGTTAVAMTDRALGTKIAHGPGSGQLSYQGHTVSGITVDASDCSFTVSRTFANTSGADITVTETGVYTIQQTTVPSTSFHAIVRDVLGSSVTVSDGEVLTVTYTYKISV